MNAKSTIKIAVGLTDKYRQSQFIATGALPNYSQVVEYDLTQATPEQRAVIARATGNTLSDLHLVNSQPEWTYYNGIPDLATLTATLTADLNIRDERDRVELTKIIAEHTTLVVKAINERKPDLPFWCQIPGQKMTNIKRLGLDLANYNAALADYEKQQPTFAAEEAERLARNDQYETKRQIKLEAEKAAAEQEKQDWISANGSDHLKRACLQHGHDCQRKYIIERAGIEAPGYAVDFDDNADWKARACPSLAALDELDAVIAKNLGDPEIVWLTQSNDKNDDDFAACEAVIVRGYQGKYDLIKQIH